MYTPSSSTDHLRTRLAASGSFWSYSPTCAGTTSDPSFQYVRSLSLSSGPCASLRIAHRWMVHGLLDAFLVASEFWCFKCQNTHVGNGYRRTIRHILILDFRNLGLAERSCSPGLTCTEKILSMQSARRFEPRQVTLKSETSLSAGPNGVQDGLSGFVFAICIAL